MGHRSAGRRRTAGVLAAVATAVLAAAAPPAQAAQAVPPAPPAQATQTTQSSRTAAVRDSYIVTLKRGAGAPAASSGRGRGLVEKYGAGIRHTYSRALNGYAVRADAAQARRLAADPGVTSVTRDAEVSLRNTARNVPRKTPRTTTPDIQAHPPSWGLDRIDQPDGALDGSYRSPRSAGRGTTVYVIDSGVRTTHQDFGGRARSGWDFVDDDPVAEDGNGHGTHVAAIAAGSAYGVAKKADIVAVRVLDDRGEGTSAQVLAGLDWVLRHARRPAVVNLSLGSTAAKPVPEWDAAVRAGVASGLTFTVAAGNKDLPASSFSPGRVPQAITVGSTDRADRRSAFSNWGPAVDLFAPGDRIVSASNASDTAAQTLSGTSMAAPHVAGAAALYLADHRSAAPARVGAALTAAASKGTVRNAGTGSANRLLRVAN